MVDANSLRELHDAYVWEVNAAVGEDRMDLVWRLADEYTDRALQLIAATESPGCGRADCVICAGSTTTSAAPAGISSASSRSSWVWISIARRRLSWLRTRSWSWSRMRTS